MLRVGVRVTINEYPTETQDFRWDSRKALGS